MSKHGREEYHSVENMCGKAAIRSKRPIISLTSAFLCATACLLVNLNSGASITSMIFLWANVVDEEQSGFSKRTFLQMTVCSSSQSVCVKSSWSVSELKDAVKHWWLDVSGIKLSAENVTGKMTSDSKLKFPSDCLAAIR
jgi:hypothetical protein